MVTQENDLAGWARRAVRMRDGHSESDGRNDTEPPWPPADAPRQHSPTLQTP